MGRDVAPTFETVDALFRKGEFGDLLREANFESGLDRSLDSTSRLTVAHALAIIGQFDAAWKIADSEAQSPAANLRAKADYVLGIVSQARGDIDLASQHLRASIKSALDCREWEQLAWAQLSLFPSVHEHAGFETLAAALPDLRRTVARAGDARVSAYLHVCVASLGRTSGTF